MSNLINFGAQTFRNDSSNQKFGKNRIDETKYARS